MSIPPERRIYVNRTLNLRRIRAIGYDLDYTLVHYRVQEWERRAFDQAVEALAASAWPTESLAFDSSRVIRGLIIDLELGNLVKPTRFGYVIRATHGTQFLDFEELRRSYAGTFVDLNEPRWVFLNTLFSLSESSLYAQLVDLLDSGQLGMMNYADLYHKVRATIDETHLAGTVKGQILSDPDRFIEPDPEAVTTLLDQRHAGKRLLLITNADWAYTDRMMAYTFDSHLPDKTTWRDIFDLVIVSAAKPAFFSEQRPLYRVVDEENALLQPHHGDLEPGAVYFGGSATQIEEHLGLEGEEILYVGDHLFADVHMSKSVLRWRAALILRELEGEIEAMQAFAPSEQLLSELMAEKEALESRVAEVRLDRLRSSQGYAAAPDETSDLDAELNELQQAIVGLDDRIAPLARAAGEIRNEAWGPLMRSGYDKSLYARQVERYADVYTSRVSNFLLVTPYAFLRAAHSSLPHDLA
jgi:5'-nucleotidase